MRTTPVRPVDTLEGDERERVKRPQILVPTAAALFESASVRLARRYSGLDGSRVLRGMCAKLLE